MRMDEPLDKASAKTSQSPVEEPHTGPPVVVGERAADRPESSQPAPDVDAGSVVTDAVPGGAGAGASDASAIDAEAT